MFCLSLFGCCVRDPKTLIKMGHYERNQMHIGSGEEKTYAFYQALKYYDKAAKKNSPQGLYNYAKLVLENVNNYGFYGKKNEVLFKAHNYLGRAKNLNCAEAKKEYDRLEAIYTTATKIFQLPNSLKEWAKEDEEKEKKKKEEKEIIKKAMQDEYDRQHPEKKLLEQILAEQRGIHLQSQFQTQCLNSMYYHGYGTN